MRRAGVVLVLEAPVDQHDDRVRSHGSRVVHVLLQGRQVDGFVQMSERDHEQLVGRRDVALVQPPGVREQGDGASSHGHARVVVHARGTDEVARSDLVQGRLQPVVPHVQAVVVVDLQQVQGQAVEHLGRRVEGVGAQRRQLGGVVRRGRRLQVAHPQLAVEQRRRGEGVLVPVVADPHHVADEREAEPLAQRRHPRPLEVEVLQRFLRRPGTVLDRLEQVQRCLVQILGRVPGLGLPAHLFVRLQAGLRGVQVGEVRSLLGPVGVGVDRRIAPHRRSGQGDCPQHGEPIHSRLLGGW